MKKIMFIAGEASGDTHAAELVKALRALSPEIEMFGAGGVHLQEAGTELLVDLTQHAVVGLVEVLKNYRKFRRIFWQLVAEAERRQPDAVVLVDFPGFNLRFAAQMKKRGIPVIYYISPQLWAWHASRAKQIERDVSLMLAIFPFEKDWYAKHAPNLSVEFVGHPMLDRLTPSNGNQMRDPNLIALLPGSREREVQKIFPILAQTVDLLPENFRFIAAAASSQTAKLMSHPRVQVEIGAAHRLMQTAAIGMTASGTATMECAYYGCPMIILYKVNWFTYLIGRSLVQVEWLGMPNVIANREIVPEFIQQEAEPSKIAAVTLDLLQNKEKRSAMQNELERVIDRLGSSGASARAAQLILSAKL